MLELSPTSAQCTHGATDKLFCRCCGSVDVKWCSIHRCIVDLGLGGFKMSYQLTPIRIRVSYRRVEPSRDNNNYIYVNHVIYCKHNNLVMWA